MYGWEFMPNECPTQANLPENVGIISLDEKSYYLGLLIAVYDNLRLLINESPIYVFLFIFSTIFLVKLGLYLMAKN